MFKRILLGLVALVVLGVIGLYALAWRPAIDPIAAPAATSFPPALVAQGEVLSGAGYCATCHTAKGGKRYAGGYPMATPFGTLYSTNITPDVETGIGGWSEEAFSRAMRKGVARDGSHLFPAFPYQHFNQVSDQDIKALYAYFMTREPVHAPARAPDIPFPLNQRVLQAGWKLLFFRDNAYGPVTGKSEQWNRGAYLAEGLAHCSACHSPRNKLGAEKLGDERYAGAVIDGWYAPPLTPANQAPIPWGEEELFGYLRTGATQLHGVAAGSMSEVVHDGLSKLSDEDVRALAVYFADRSDSANRKVSQQAVLDKVLAPAAHGTRQQVEAGANVYNAACSSCHYNSGPMPLLVRPELGLNSALSASDPSTLIQIILHGVSVDDGLPGVMMPGFYQSLSNAEVVQLAAWLRSSRTTQPPWPDLEKQVATLRPSSTPAAQ